MRFYPYECAPLSSHQSRVPPTNKRRRPATDRLLTTRMETTMIRTTALAALASVALAIATTAASAQSLTAHAPPSDKATQGSDPNMRKSAGDKVVPNSDEGHQKRKAGWDTKPSKKI